MGAWQPIADMPEAGVDVLVFCPDANTPVMICHHFGDNDGWYEQNPNIGPPLDVDPTHWMPLPEPPEAS